MPVRASQAACSDVCRQRIAAAVADRALCTVTLCCRATAAFASRMCRTRFRTRSRRFRTRARQPVVNGLQGLFEVLPPPRLDGVLLGLSLRAPGRPLEGLLRNEARLRRSWGLPKPLSVSCATLLPAVAAARPGPCCRHARCGRGGRSNRAWRSRA